MALMDDLTRDDESTNTGSSPIRRLTGLAQASASAAPALALQSQGEVRQSPIQRLTGGPLARAATLATGNPMDDGSLSAGVQSAAGQSSTPRIAQMAAGDSTAGSGRGSVNPPNAISAGDGRGFVNPPNVQPSPIAALTARSASGPTNVSVGQETPERASTIAAMRQQAMAPRIAQVATPVQQPDTLAGGIIGGGDTTYSPGMAARTDPFTTADGRKLDPNDPNLSADDRGAIGQYKANNAQMAADIERQQRTNPLAGAVQIIRPGNEVSYAVQSPDRMVELQAPAYAQYQSAFERNPGMAGRAQMTEAGVTVDGNLAPANVVGFGDAALKTYNANAQKDAMSGMDAETLAKIAQENAKSQGAAKVAEITGNAHIEGARLAAGAAKSEVLQSDQGPVIIDKRTGEAKPATLNGQPLAAKLKDMPAPAQKALLENNTSLRKIDSALAAIDAYPDALGAKNYLGDSIRQRSDPKGIEARALVADIGSLVLHDRSGVSVTAAETPRLQPFIPAATDSPEVARKKLALFKNTYDGIQQDILSTYSPEQGYKQFGSKTPATPTQQPAAPGSTPNARGIDLTKVKPGDGNYEAVMADAARIGALRNQKKTASVSSKPSLNDIFGDK